MIKRLRIKFVCINMTIVTLMLAFIFGLVLHFTSTGMERESIEMMHNLAMNPRQLAIPGKHGPENQLPHFALQTGPGGEWEVSGSGNYDLTDKDMLANLIELSATQKSGVLKEYGLRFIRVSTPNSQRIVFADISRESSIMNNLMQTCLLIGAVSFIAFLAISILLAHWAVKPVEVAWEQQRQFVADASHELKTPLTVILSNAQMLAENGENTQQRERLTNSIITVSKQMKELVIKLLDCAKVDTGIDAMQFAKFNLSTSVSNSLLLFDPIFYEQGLKLQSEICDCIWVRGSQPHLTQVMDILLDNAQKYSNGQGLTLVSLFRQGKKSCLLKVSNEGQQISARELKNIFKRFYRADSARERNGSYGLGLAIAEGIVKAHKGKIWAESIDGMNTFYVQLPCCIDASGNQNVD